jgi:hypothetical protein
MRRLLFAVPLLLACAGSEEMPPADEPATAMAAVTEADVAGTWTGTAMIEGTDSVFSHWTSVCGGGTCRLTSQEAPADTSVSNYTMDADSVIGTGVPTADPTMGGVMVVDHWVGRVSGGMVTANGWITLAEKPDSVLMRYRVTGTKSP